MAKVKHRLQTGRKRPRRIFGLLPLFILAGFSAIPTPADGRIPVIIDTDPAMGVPLRDVDDGLMLIVALHSPELDILGVTAAWGNDRQAVTFAKAREILQAAGRSDIPCLRGARGPQDFGLETPASRFITETVLAHPRQIAILAVGTLTNLATALYAKPGLAPAIPRIVSMGGTLAPPGRWPFWAVIDLNYGADVKSARLVLERRVPFVMVHSGLCRQVLMTPERYQRMVTTAPHLRGMLAEQCRGWNLLNQLAVQVPGRRGFVPWDVVALAYLLHPEWFHDNWVRVEIDNAWWAKKTVVIHEQGLEPGTGVNAPDRIIGEEKFWEWFFSRI